MTERIQEDDLAGKLLKRTIPSKAVEAARRLSVGERKNEKTPHFSACCDSWCNSSDCGMHIIVKSKSRSSY